MKKILISVFIVLITLNVFSATIDLERVEPMFWWAGMKSPDLQLMVYGENISTAEVSLEYPGVTLYSVSKVENPNYLFVDLK
ncbi:MAG: cyclomaltodextrinase N-terminal domain-containing protein, partial [Mariniphaga sp.]|nr:cyclomaltodextrinase N-terminal domain-containing protein [Mariniphaga sp.]